MKRLCIVCILLCAAGCATSAKNGPSVSEPAVTAAVADQNEGWYLFSQGMLYKNRYESQGEDAGREEALNSAIEYLEKSLEKSDPASLPRIYAHLADCWFYRSDFQRALDFGRRAIAGDPAFQPPYNRLYAIYMKLQNYQKAAEVLEAYLLVDPEAIHFHLALGDLYMKNLNETDKAESVFKKVIELADRTGADDYYREQANASLGYISFRKNEIEKSIEYFEKAHGYNLKNDSVIYMLAHLNMYIYNIDSADRYALEYNAMMPDNTSIAAVLGRIRYMRRDPSALGYLRAGGVTRSGDGLVARGLLLEMEGDPEEAGAAIQALLQWKADCIEARMAMAFLLDKKGRGKEASAEYVNAGILAVNKKLPAIAGPLFRRAQELGDSRVELHYYLGRIEEDQAHYAGAIYHYGKLKESESDVELVLHIGYLHGLRRDYSAAVAFFDRAVRLEPENPRTHFFRGLGSMWLKDYAESERYMIQAVRKGGAEENNFFYLAVVQEKQNKQDEAVLSLKSALKAEPGSARAMNYLGYIYADRGINLDEAEGLIGKALEIEPDNGAYIDSLGWVFYRKGDYTRALDLLLKAEKRLDETDMADPVVFEHIGDACLALGDRDRALHYWKKSLKMEDRESVREKIRANGGDVSNGN